MILGTAKMHTDYYRMRNGVQQHCRTTRTVYHLRCDSCGAEFTKTSKQFNHRSSAHCCDINCNPRKFAQKQSAILRKFTKWDASSSKTI